MKARNQDAARGMGLARWLPLVIFISCVAGCSGRSTTAQVRGRVTFKDGSIPLGEVCVVRFEPTPDSTATIRKAASGEIGRDGSFAMYTRKPGDGVLLGSYAVTFSVWKDRFNPESLIAEKYTSASTTPYKVDVEGDLDDLVFEIEPVEETVSESSESVESTEDLAVPSSSDSAAEPQQDDAKEQSHE